jgi:predicted dehydrogenase
MKTERKLRIFLDDAYLSLDLQQKILTTIRKREATGDTELPVTIDEQSFEQGDALRAEIEAFLAACRGERKVAVSGEEGLRALQTAISITEKLTAAA